MCSKHSSETTRRALLNRRVSSRLVSSLLSPRGRALTRCIGQRKDDHARVAALEVALKEAEGNKRDVEKEQEDLLVLLDEMSTKRRRDKARMREVGLEVSEDEGEGVDEDEDGGE